jgi:hypothetical protein
MNNIKTFTEDPKFLQLNKNNKESILKVDQALCKEGYVFNGNWRDDPSSDGCNASFELVNSNIDRKNLVTLRPMKKGLKVEVYWGYSKNRPLEKKSKQYYYIMSDNDISELLEDVRELYDFYF